MGLCGCVSVSVCGCLGVSVFWFYKDSYWTSGRSAFVGQSSSLRPGKKSTWPSTAECGPHEARAGASAYTGHSPELRTAQSEQMRLSRSTTVLVLHNVIACHSHNWARYYCLGLVRVLLVRIGSGNNCSGIIGSCIAGSGVAGSGWFGYSWFG